MTAFLRLDRLRACLQHVELAVTTILAPFDVHRAAVVLLDDHGVTGKFLHFGIVERELVTLGFGDIDGHHRFSGRFFAGKNHLDQLRAEVATDHGMFAGSQHRLMHVELVRIHGTLHHRFTKAIGGCNENRITEAGFGIEREHHAGRTGIRAHHALHARRQGDIGMDEVLVHAVGDGAVVVKRGKNFLDRVQDVVEPVDVEEGLLLAGK